MFLKKKCVVDEREHITCIGALHTYISVLTIMSAQALSTKVMGFCFVLFFTVVNYTWMKHLGIHVTKILLTP